MPRGDRTGPLGAGPMTGRAAGFCAGYSMPGYANPGFGMGRGRGFFGRGGGRGRRNMVWATGMPGWARAVGFAPQAAAPMTAEDELADLKQQAQWMQENLNRINERIGEISQETDK